MDFQAFLARLRGLAGTMSRAQLVSLALSFVLVVAVIGGSALWLNTPTYALLFADMDQETAASMVSRLKQLKVDYKLDDGGRAIRVASSRVDELRLELTAQGLPSSGRIGFEIFDRTTFGTTEFVEQVNFRRALEGEIARTISTLSSVSSARVHIAPGKDPLFGEKQSATASVVLKLKDARGLSASTASGIANLVAASVEGLHPDAVVILDSGGHPLTSAHGEDQLGAAQVERQQRLERDMTTRVIALLDPVVGEGRARVNVALKLNPTSREQTEEKFDPETIVRSRSTATDVTSQPGAGGVAGTRGNLPTPTPPPPVQTASAGSSRQNEVTNYEVSKTTTHTIEPPGDVARLSVAVILDDAHESSIGKDGKQTVKRVARKPEELQKLEALVATAVGLDESRGDRVTVQNIAFDDPLPVEPESPGFLVRYERPLQEGGRTVAVLVVGLVALLLLKSMFSRTMTGSTPALAEGPRPAALAASAMPRTVAELESEIDGQLGGGGGDSRRLPALTRRVAGLAQKEPATTAKLLRSWMTEGS
jgi:flagellar M-ring protein FliF